ncbi:hypothetical protein G7Y89_g8473 [Cudoniella acicularis]|uniref:non-specific serine/threonine protein kinase n=1 Tax=Cudoniella acicularis TaxID=354080 RepID=A0A8H4RIL8_9HELO|nr:hypothetical protein G7Y89_g8473 [Cudoniella acicularis]
MANDAATIERASKKCAELRDLPKGWQFKFDNDDRVYFLKDDISTYNHPTLGGLPKPWILKMVRSLGTWSVDYYNRDTGATSAKDPRFLESTLSKHASVAPRELRISASSTRNTNLDLDQMQRNPIGNRNIRDQYEVVHAIDPGDGTLGAMNGGVFVVRIKNLPSKLFIEKRFKPDPGLNELFRKEIRMLHKVRHPALTSYSAGFINGLNLSVYIEFCDRGSLNDMINKYVEKVYTVPKPMPSEAFIWHAFGGLADALAYLQTGSSWLHKPNPQIKRDWVPILHRDIKPDNVLLRSRSTVGSSKYFYCILSDFGLACEDYPYDHPDADGHQISGHQLGTYSFCAPELCYNLGKEEGALTRGSKFPPGQRHTGKSDVWSLGVCIYALGKIFPSAEYAHLAMGKQPPVDICPKGACKWTSQVSRRKMYPYQISRKYSDELREGVIRATEWNLEERPDAVQLVRELEVLQRQAGFLTQQDAEPLPDWCTRKHEYFAKAEKAERDKRR